MNQDIQAFIDKHREEKTKPDFLAHYGIPGMRWGKRKGSSSVSTSKKSTKSTKSSDAFSKSSKNETTKSKVSKISDTELKKRVARLNLEKQYLDLTKPKQSAGKKFVTSVLNDASKQLATKYAVKYGTEYIEKAIKAASKLK